MIFCDEHEETNIEENFHAYSSPFPFTLPHLTRSGQPYSTSHHHVLSCLSHCPYKSKDLLQRLEKETVSISRVIQEHPCPPAHCLLPTAVFLVC